MSVPTITTIAPETGPTGGWSLIEIAGTNFRLPTSPPPAGPVPPRPQSVQVLFGTTAAMRVDVLSTTRLRALTPIHDVGIVSVTVRNIYDSGLPIPSETVTKANAFTFQRPVLTVESDLARLVRGLIQELRRQIILGIGPLVHTDFDSTPSDGLNVTECAKLPTIVVTGPDVAENRFFSINEPQEYLTGDAVFSRARVPQTVDLTFQFVAASDSAVELLNLEHATLQFFQRTKWVYMLRNAVDPTLGAVRYELTMTSPFKAASLPNESNLRQFNGEFVVRGFDVEGISGVLDDAYFDRGCQVADDGIIITTERTGGS